MEEKNIEDLKNQAEEYLAGWKRAKADFVNYQKQVEKEKAEWLLFSSAGCVKAFLPVLDSLEAAGSGSGVEKIRDQMVEVMKSLGVEEIKCVGEPIDPQLHEVVATQVCDEISSGLVAKEVQRGYTLHGRLLRAAKVIVSE